MALAPASNRSVAISDNEMINADRLRENFAPFDLTLTEYEAQAASVPARIDDDETCGTWQDTYKAIDAHAKSIEGARIDVKEPYLNAGRVVDGFFKGMTTRATKAQNQIGNVIQDYLRRKAAEARRKQEVEAKRLRDEQLAKEAEALAAEERARRQEEAGRKSRAAASQVVADAARDAANLAAMEAQEREAQSRENSATHARTRSDAGTLGTLADRWEFSVTDWDDVKGAKLWSLVSRDAKEKAIRQYIRLHAPKSAASDDEFQPIEGVKFYRTSNLQVR